MSGSDLDSRAQNQTSMGSELSVSLDAWFSTAVVHMEFDRPFVVSVQYAL
jgi:hypothetical protein